MVKEELNKNNKQKETKPMVLFIDGCLGKCMPLKILIVVAN